MPPRERAPWPLVAAAGAAILVGLLDAIPTLLSLAGVGPEGRTGGTLLRDAVLVVAGAFALRRARWAQTALVVLFALTLLRVAVADEPVEFAGVALAAVGLVLMLLPATRAWFREAT